MTRRSSLKASLGWWFAGALLLLYGSAATMGWLYASATERQFAVLTLKTETESLAAYVAESLRLDAPELREPEDAPIRMWFRVLRAGKVVASTPGTPDVAPDLSDPDKVVSVAFRDDPAPFVVVRHAVAGPSGVTVEAVGSLAPIVHRERVLAAGLLLAGFVVIPFAVLGGRALAGRALRPVDDLVREIRGLDTTRLDERLALPDGTTSEIAVLAGAFNDLLERLEGTLEGMRRFTADASHEIRNPLSVLRAGLEIALRRERTPEEYRLLLRENLQEIERLHAVVESILALARSVPGTPYAIAHARVDLSAIVESTRRGFETVAAERGVAWRLGIEPEILVDGDERLLRLAAFNLIDNALKHTPDGEWVRVEVARRDAFARVVVADGGPGVAEKDRPFVFQRFFRGEAGEKKGGVGGLGLSVVRWVADLHRGSALLLDEGPGATFAFEVPALESGGSPEAP